MTFNSLKNDYFFDPDATVNHFVNEFSPLTIKEQVNEEIDKEKNIIQKEIMFLKHEYESHENVPQNYAEALESIYNTLVASSLGVICDFKSALSKVMKKMSTEVLNRLSIVLFDPKYASFESFEGEDVYHIVNMEGLRGNQELYGITISAGDYEINDKVRYLLQPIESEVSAKISKYMKQFELTPHFKEVWLDEKDEFQSNLLFRLERLSSRDIGQAEWDKFFEIYGRLKLFAESTKEDTGELEEVIDRIDREESKNIRLWRNLRKSIDRNDPAKIKNYNRRRLDAKIKLHNLEAISHYMKKYKMNTRPATTDSLMKELFPPGSLQESGIVLVLIANANCIIRVAEWKTNKEPYDRVGQIIPYIKEIDEEFIPKAVGEPDPLVADILYISFMNSDDGDIIRKEESEYESRKLEFIEKVRANMEEGIHVKGQGNLATNEISKSEMEKIKRLFGKEVISLSHSRKKELIQSSILSILKSLQKIKTEEFSKRNEIRKKIDKFKNSLINLSRNRRNEKTVVFGSPSEEQKEFISRLFLLKESFLEGRNKIPKKFHGKIKNYDYWGSLIFSDYTSRRNIKDIENLKESLATLGTVTNLAISGFPQVTKSMISTGITSRSSSIRGYKKDYITNLPQPTAPYKFHMGAIPELIMTIRMMQTLSNFYNGSHQKGSDEILALEYYNSLLYSLSRNNSLLPERCEINPFSKEDLENQDSMISLTLRRCLSYNPDLENLLIGKILNETCWPSEAILVGNSGWD
jgi:hypothetical protein